MVIWFIGMSGSGKTTLGREVVNQLRRFSPNTVFLDGDDVRAVCRHDRGEHPYTVEGRRINAERITALCELLDRQGIHVVCCVLSIFPEMRSGHRQRFSDYFEVFMDAPLNVLESRDVKGLYASARRGQASNVVGMDIPFPRPEQADMVVDSSGAGGNVDELATHVLKKAGLLQ